MVAASFDWDEDRNRESQRKYGVSFEVAQWAFADAKRVIAEDASHRQSEKRYYCFGQVGSGILTVRFTYRGGIIRIIGAGYWRRGKKIYERQGSLHKRAIGHRARCGGFPSPVTMLRKSSVEFFKAEAKKYPTSYQAMIRRLLDLYAAEFSKAPSTGPRGRR